MRSLFLYSQAGNPTIRVPMPYVKFVFQYRETEIGQKPIIYDGIGGAGLRIYGSLKPLESFKDHVLFCANDKL